MTALTIVIIGIIGIGIAVFLFVLYACCVAAGRADDQMERAIEEMRRK